MIGRMALFKWTTVGVLVASFAALTHSSSNKWKQFRSSDAFSVEYPSSWFRFGSSGGRLNILSSKRGAEGVVIAKGEAYIFVRQEPLSAAHSMAQVIDQYSQGAAPLSRADVPAGQRGSCNQLQEVVWKEPPVAREDVPSRIRVTDFVYTGLFCRIGGRNITVMLKNWQGDPRQAEYQRVALRVAKSIRPIQ